MNLLTEIFKFFNSAPGDERWQYASDFAEYFGDVLSSGLLHKDNVPSLQVTIIPNSLKTKVDRGQALIKGYSYRNTEPIEMTHDITEVGLNRIDRIVLRLDLRNANRYIRVFVKKGEEAVKPVPPSLQRDNYIYELSLAQIQIISNSTSINPTTLKDERMDEELCGLVSSLISVPTSVFQQQWDYWFSAQKGQYVQEMLNWMNEQQTTFSNWMVNEQTVFSDWMLNEQNIFNKWFSTIQGSLEGDIAANLTSRLTIVEEKITAHQEDEMPHKYTDSTTGKTYKWGMGSENGVSYLIREEII